MNICYNADDNYLRPLQVAIYSLCKFNNFAITVHIINYGGILISDFDFLMERFDLNIKIYTATKEMKSMPSKGRFTPAVYGRLFIPQLINEDKIIYLDVDTLVMSDISDLWKTQCKSVMATLEFESETIMALKLKYDLKRYFNAGVMLISIKDVLTEFNHSIEVAKNIELEYLDQDALNIAFNDNFKELNSINNYMSCRGKLDGVKIVHFAHLKPWKSFSLHPYAKEYRKLEVEIENYLTKKNHIYKTSLYDVVKSFYMRLV